MEETADTGPVRGRRTAPGGHVLFMDGHIEYIEYPGRFPMTETFIEALRGLDALREQAASPAEPSVGD